VVPTGKLGRKERSISFTSTPGDCIVLAILVAF